MRAWRPHEAVGWRPHGHVAWPRPAGELPVPGHCLADLVADPGCAVGDLAAGPGHAIDDLLAGPGCTLDDLLAGPRRALDDLLASPGCTLDDLLAGPGRRSDAQPSELQTLIRNPYAVFCLKN